MSEPTVTAIR